MPQSQGQRSSSPATWPQVEQKISAQITALQSVKRSVQSGQTSMAAETLQELATSSQELYAQTQSAFLSTDGESMVDDVSFMNAIDRAIADLDAARTHAQRGQGQGVTQDLRGYPGLVTAIAEQAMFLSTRKTTPA